MHKFSLTDSLIFVYVTTHCNLRCRHCYLGHLLDKPKHMDIDQLRNVLRYGRVIGFWQVEFLGGEPLMYPQLSAAIQEAKKLDFQVFISTNGTIPYQLDHQIDYLSISFDQADSNKEGMRPQLDFSKFERNIPHIKSKTNHLSATITLSTRNMHEIEQIFDFCKENGFDTVLIHYFTPLGVGAQSQDMVIPPDKYEEITDWIVTNSKRYPFRIRYQPKYLCRKNATENAKRMGLRYLGNRSRILGEGLAVFPDMTVHFDPLFFDKEPLGWCDGTGIKFNPATKELDALFRISTNCLNCKDSAICGGYDSVYHAYPEQHQIHAICNDKYLPIETTWTVTT